MNNEYSSLSFCFKDYLCAWLQQAVASVDLDKINFLLRNWPTECVFPNIYGLEFSRGVTLLLLAVEKDHWGLLDFLIPTREELTRQQPLSYARLSEFLNVTEAQLNKTYLETQDTLLDIAIRKGNLNAVGHLLDAGVDIGFKRTMGEWVDRGMLWVAVYSPQIPNIYRVAEQLDIILEHLARQTFLPVIVVAEFLHIMTEDPNFMSKNKDYQCLDRIKRMAFLVKELQTKPNWIRDNVVAIISTMLKVRQASSSLMQVLPQQQAEIQVSTTPLAPPSPAVAQPLHFARQGRVAKPKVAAKGGDSSRLVQSSALASGESKPGTPATLHAAQPIVPLQPIKQPRKACFDVALGPAKKQCKR